MGLEPWGRVVSESITLSAFGPADSETHLGVCFGQICHFGPRIFSFFHFFFFPIVKRMQIIFSYEHAKTILLTLSLSYIFEWQSWFYLKI